MKKLRYLKLLVLVGAALLMLTTGAVASDKGPSEKAPQKKLAASDHKVPKYFVPPPPFSEGIFPCSQCHADMKSNPERRELYYHTEIAEGFNHAEEQRWCLDCHNPDDRDQLRLVSGKLLSFEKSYSLCGQCHGTIFRDWKAGIHGKRSGEWNGQKLYRLCVHCHNPHQPKFKQIKPLPAPMRPDQVRYKVLKKDEIPRNPLGDLQ